MGRATRIPDPSAITPDTPLRLAAAAVLAFPAGGMTESDLKRAIREGRLTCEVVGGHTFVTLAYINDMAPGAVVPIVAEGKGIVYVVGFGRYVKIGFTRSDLEQRLSNISTGCPEPLTLYAAIEADRGFEYEIHSRFAAFRLRGEWFVKKWALAAWIKGGCRG